VTPVKKQMKLILNSNIKFNVCRNSLKVIISAYGIPQQIQTRELECP
jgi:hypothetical protein